MKYNIAILMIIASTNMVGFLVKAQTTEGRGIPFAFVGPPPEMMSKEEPSHDRVPLFVHSKTLINVYEYFNLDKHCQPNKFHVVISKPPSNGTAYIAPSNFHVRDLIQRIFAHPINGGADSRLRCKLSNYESTLVTYKPNAGFFGNDSIIISVSDHSFVSTEYITLVVH